MGIAKSLIIRLSLGKDLDWSYASVYIWQMVVKVSRMRDCKGPEAFVLHIWPHQLSIDHHSASFGSDKTDSRFSSTILPLGANTTKQDGLGVRANLLEVGLLLKIPLSV